MRVTVFGLGFVGLTTAVGLAQLGHTVYGIDIDDTRRAALRAGRLPFQEPGLQEALLRQSGRHFFLCDDVGAAVTDSEVIFYCVGTPCGAHGTADLSSLFQAIDTTVAAVHDAIHRVLVVKSTVPPSTTEKRIAPHLAQYAPKGLFHLANNPEFLREGHCWEDFTHADRIVIGTGDPFAREKLTQLYQPMGLPICCTSATTGEFIKYLSNTLLATMISYSNEMAEIAGYVGDIDVAQAFRILHMDKRWSGCEMTSYVYPGCGYGGYCLPKDTKALFAKSSEEGFVPPILGAVIQTNEDRPTQIAAQILKTATPGQVIGILGLAFKPGSDDVRESPAASIILALQDLGCRELVAYDPVASRVFQAAYPELPLHYCDSLEDTCRRADVLAIVTAWPEFRAVREIGKPLVDCRYML